MLIQNLHAKHHEHRAYVTTRGEHRASEDTAEALEKRLRSIGCPADVIVRTRRRFETRAAQPTTAPVSDVELKRRIAVAGAQIAADEKRDRAKQLAIDVQAAKAANEQKRKDDDLAARMKAASGRTTC